MTYHIPRGLRPLSLLALAALAACGGSGDDDTAARYSAEIRRTTMGVPHIKADSWAGVGYGSGYAQAEDNLCTMADSFLTYRGERSKYIGGDAQLVASGTTFVPSLTTMKLASSPAMNSSITTRAWPGTVSAAGASPSIMSMAACASSTVVATTTPLPAASPSALMTRGYFFFFLI